MSTDLRMTPTARVREVIEVEKSEGKGTEESPVRLVTYYLSLDGKVLARFDHMTDADLVPVYD